MRITQDTVSFLAPAGAGPARDPASIHAPAVIRGRHRGRGPLLRKPSRSTPFSPLPHQRERGRG